MSHCASAFYRRWKWTASIVAACLFAQVSAFAPAQAQQADQPRVSLAPHRAVYNITLAESKAGSGVGEAVGRMVYEITGNACDGYTQNMRFVTRIAGSEGNTVLSDVRSSTWESGAGDRFRFQTSQIRDQNPAETTVGDARREAGRIAVELTRPDKKDVSIDSSAVFPVQHTMALIEAAMQGKTLFTAKLYDGSEKGDKIYTTTAAIGRVQPPGANSKLPKATSAEPLDALRSWPVSISYFESGKPKEDAAPDYELAFLAFENGVSRKLFIDYGEFAIRGTLTEIEFLKPETSPCRSVTK